MTGCTVDSVTLSVEQKALAEQRIAEAGLESKIKVHLMDYRDFPASWTDSFDRVCSIEMLEAVGIEFLPIYFSCVDRVLKRQGGVAVFQCITMPESRAEAYYKGVDFIRKMDLPRRRVPLGHLARQRRHRRLQGQTSSSTRSSASARTTRARCASGTTDSRPTLTRSSAPPSCATTTRSATSPPNSSSTRSTSSAGNGSTTSSTARSASPIASSTTTFSPSPAKTTPPSPSARARKRGTSKHRSPHTRPLALFRCTN